jgi:hypothetical protein
MPSYLSTPLQRFGLLNEQPTTPERAFVEEVSDESSAEIRQVPDRNTDTEGETVFSSFRSVVELSAYDIGDLPTVEQWMTARQPVKLVATTPDVIIQWTEATRVRGRPVLTPEEAALVEAEYAMTRDAGGKDTHGVYLTRNALAPVGASGAISATLAWPVDGVGLTLSADFSNVDGTETLSLEALDSDKTTVIDSATVTPGSSGRASLDFTTPDGTYYLAVEVSGANPAEPALRVDGSDQYVAK